jgi:large subunit ribosomal protein L19e
MSNLRLQKRLAGSILKCGVNKVWIDPNEIGDIQGATTRQQVRKFIRDGFVIKKPQKIHSRFRARKRAVEVKKGRHLGMGKRKGTSNARNPVRVLWRRKQRAYRRLLSRYRETGHIDSRMYHRLYLRAKGGTFKNRANLIDHIDQELQEKKRNAVLLMQYRAKRNAALQRKNDREAAQKRRVEELASLAQKAELMVIAAKKKATAKPAKKTTDEKKPVAKGKAAKGKAAKEEAPASADGGKKKRKRKRGPK